MEMHALAGVLLFVAHV